ncbi:MAG TPA: efflux RND transporter permease subunit [Myxococcota bacterium]|nr:efflux RND transporter permease subunit [Myxococcota bacterium]HNZ02780.1 efflux RND transporter permease subunit [Myxococcota bacterium]HPB51134.1 efflux RND transporter permease subunit [Myxococcota bacterium]HQP96477.1 efflux RND transporter permease subunit [Myxococcota bacterium]
MNQPIQERRGFSAIFIRRPVATIILMAALLIVGIGGFVNLSVNNLPTVDFPTIQVMAALPGANPETMAAAVAAPLEKQFSAIQGIKSITSTSFQGSTRITLEFDLERNIDAAAQDVQTAIAAATRQLPKDMQMPSYWKSNPADMPILMYALTSDTLPLSTLDEYAQTLLGQNISMVSGVAQVDVRGSQKYAVRIQLDPARLASMGLSVTDVYTAVREQNQKLATGTLWGDKRLTSIETNAQLKDAEDFKPLIIAYQDGALVRLRDLGEVKDDVENSRSAGWYIDSRSIILSVNRQPGSNATEVADNVREKVERLQTQLPESVKLHLMFDRSESIRESVHDVELTLVLTLILVVAVIFLFLRNASATLIPSLALPLSLITTFGVMYLLDYTLDNLSLMALTLSLGFVVDDAVVMLENIFRHMEMGKSRLRAAYDGAKEIEFTIISMTLSLIAVFIPLLLMSGIVGRLFREFAVVISVAIAASGLISLTLSPMMGSLALKMDPRHGPHSNRPQPIWNAVKGFYERTLAGVMRHRVITVVISVLMLGATGFLFVISPKGFLPPEDIGMISVTTEAAEGTSFGAMVPLQQQVMEIVAADPAVSGFNSSVGQSSWSLSNQGRMFVQLKNRRDRDASVDEVIARLRPKLAAIPGMRVYMQNPPPIRIGGMSSKAMYQFTLQSTDTATLYEWTGRLEQELRGIPELVDVNSDLSLKNPQIVIDVDRDRASALGVSSYDVEQTLNLAFSSTQISTIYTQTNQYYVLLELLPDYQKDMSALDLLFVKARDGTMVPLNSLATVRETVGPLSINHLGQIPAATISFNLRPDVSISEASARVQQVADQMLPSSINTSFQGQAQAFAGSESSMLVLLLLAILVIYMILAILYESFVHPVTILTGLPFAAFGALLTLQIFGMELSLYAYVGIIMLIGVVKKNAIMMVDFAIEAEKAGASARDAILEAASVRFRPIMMTTVAAIVGTLPIALGLGAGGESRQPLGLVVVGGLLFSQLITLYVTPVFYTYFDRLQTASARIFGRRDAV